MKPDETNANDRSGSTRNGGVCEDVLLSRVIERTDSHSDWTELKRLAVADIQVWSRLAQSMEAESQLRSSSQQLTDLLQDNPVNWTPTIPADAVDPAQTLLPPLASGSKHVASYRSEHWLRSISKLAALLLVFVSGWLLADARIGSNSREIPGTEIAPSLQVAGGPEPIAPKQGTPVSRSMNSTELIPLVIDSRPASNGFEITYMRRILEREIVPSLFSVGMNDAEMPALERVQLAGDFNSY